MARFQHHYVNVWFGRLINGEQLWYPCHIKTICSSRRYMCRPLLLKIAVQVIQGRRQGGNQAFSNMLVSLARDVCALLLFISSDTQVIRHTAKALFTRNWQRPVLQRHEKRVTLKSSLKGTISMPCLWLTLRQRVFFFLFPFPSLSLTKDTTMSCTQFCCLARDSGNHFHRTHISCAQHTGRFFSTHNAFPGKGNQKTIYCAERRSG